SIPEAVRLIPDSKMLIVDAKLKRSPTRIVPLATPAISPQSAIGYRLSAIRHRLLPAATLVLICWFFFFFRLADLDFWISYECLAAQNAQSIIEHGYWGLPRQFSGQIELQKPPMYYWLVAGVAWLNGGQVDAWAVRLPAAAAALGCCLLLYF